MQEIAALLHFFSIGFVLVATSLGVGFGGGLASTAVLDAIDIQPAARTDINRVSLITLALIETSGILGIVLAFMLLRMGTGSLIEAISEVGIAFSLGITGLVVGYVSAWPAISASKAIARQPFFSQKIMTLLLITMSLIQTPVIFGFLIALLIMNARSSVEFAPQAWTLVASGLCMGLGSIGPGIGLARFAEVACKSIGINPQSYSRILPFTFISEAIIETPLIFSMIIALILSTRSVPDNPLAIAIAFAAALAVGLGTLGPSLSSSKTAQAACAQIARAPESSTLLSRTSLIGQALIDAAAIYALLVSLLMLIL